MRKSFGFVISLLIVVLLACNHYFRFFSMIPTAWGDGEGAEFRVMTYNVHSSDRNFGFICDDLAIGIISIDADAILLNEFPIKNYQTIDSLLRLSYTYSTFNIKDCGHGMVLYSKYAIADWHKVDVGSMGGYVYSGIVEKDDSKIRLMGCHLCSNNYLTPHDRMEVDELRTKEDYQTYLNLYKIGLKHRTVAVDSMFSYLSKDSIKTIILGDFNDFPWSEPLRTLEQAGFEDAWWNGGFGYGSTFSQGWVSLRLDHIYYDKGFRLKDVKIFDNNGLSDHKAIEARLEIKD